MYFTPKNGTRVVLYFKSNDSKGVWLFANGKQVACVYNYKLARSQPGLRRINETETRKILGV